MVFYHIVISVITGIIMLFLGYLIYKRHSIMLWGLIASFMFDSPVLIQVPLGVSMQSLYWVLALSHTLGILIFPIILVVIDVILIELDLVGYFKSLSFMLPKSFKTLLRLEGLVERFQKYSFIPMPERLQSVFMIGVLAGVVHLVINLIVGVL